MARPLVRPTLLNSFMTVGTAVAVMGLVVACDSGTQEPAAPIPATPDSSTGSEAATEQAVVPTPTRDTPSDGSIASDRFPTELPEGTTAEIPSTLPSSLPIYPGAAPAIGGGGTVDGGARAGVQLLSNDSPSTIHGYYESELRANGWEITESNTDDLSSSLMGTNGDCRASIFVVPSPKGGSDIFVVSEC